MEVLLITGACGVGKTTLAKAWAEAKNGAIIECDYLTEWIYQKSFPHWLPEEEKFTAKLAAVMAEEYLDFGMSVAIENVWFPTGLTMIRDRLLAQRPDLKVTAVWLTCALPENHRRDQQRIPDHQMRERVDIVNQELADCTWPAFVKRMDTTNQTVAVTLTEL